MFFHSVDASLIDLFDEFLKYLAHFFSSLRTSEKFIFLPSAI